MNITLDPVLFWLVISLAVLALSATWFWSKTVPADAEHWMDPFYVAIGFAAAFGVLSLMTIIFVEGVISLL